MGRRQFESVVAQAPKVQIKSIDLSSSAVVSSGQTETIDYFVPSGSVGEVKSIYFQVPTPTGATTSVHRAIVSTNFGNLSVKGTYLDGMANFGKSLLYNGDWVDADFHQYPTDKGAQFNSQSTIVFDSERSFRISYINNTNVAQSNKRNIALIYLEREVR